MRAIVRMSVATGAGRGGTGPAHGSLSFASFGELWFHLDFSAEFQDELIESKFRFVKKTLKYTLRIYPDVGMGYQERVALKCLNSNHRHDVRF